MPIGAHNILSKVDRAIVAYLVANGLDEAMVFPGKHAFDKPAPCVVVWSERGEVPHPPEAIYEVTTNVYVKTVPGVEPDETEEGVKTVSEELVTQVFDLLWSGLQDSGHELGELLTEAGRAAEGGDLAEFTITEAMPTQCEASFEAKGNAWVDTLVLKVLACPRDVS